MSNNTQLPVEVVEQIKTNAAIRAYHDEGKDNSSFANGYYSGYISGATAYATKLQEVEKDRDELRQWKMEAVEQLMPIGAYCHKHLEVNIGDSCTDLVIAELDRLRQENEKVIDYLRRLRNITTWLEMPNGYAELLNGIDNYLKPH